MSKRPGRPPLYDLMKVRPESAPARPAPETPIVPTPPPDDPGQSWLTPGRVIRLPVGYLLVGVTVVLIVLVGAYVAGQQQGRAAARTELEALFLADGSSSAPIAGLRDPLVEDRAPAGTGTRALGTSEPTISHAGPGDAARSEPRSWRPLDTDPRRSGLSYFVLAETTPDGATRLARFCRDNGLETYVVSSKNTRLRQVIALPGFVGSRRSPEARALESTIYAIGDLWRNAEPGATNLRDAYPVTHR